MQRLETLWFVICNQQVRGSNPLAGTISLKDLGRRSNPVEARRGVVEELALVLRRAPGEDLLTSADQVVVFRP